MSAHPMAWHEENQKNAESFHTRECRRVRQDLLCQMTRLFKFRAENGLGRLRLVKAVVKRKKSFDADRLLVDEPYRYTSTFHAGDRVTVHFYDGDRSVQVTGMILDFNKYCVILGDGQQNWIILDTANIASMTEV